MSVTRCSVGELRRILANYSDNLNVVIRRGDEFHLTTEGEFDGAGYYKLVDMVESWDVYLPSELKGEGETVLLLSATPFEEGTE